MSPHSRIATMAASSALVAMPIAGALFRPAAPGSTLVGSALDSLVPSVLFATLVWVGTRLAVRWIPESQRTTRLGWALVLAYIAVSILVSLPIVAHAVVVSLPGADADVPIFDIIYAVAFAVGGLVAPVVLAVVLACGLAPLCAWSRRARA